MATNQARGRGGACDVVCLSHLRWDFVWQRPQHLMSRCARERRVFFVEEPVRGAERAEIVVTPRDEAPAISRRPWTPHSPRHSCSPASCDCDSIGSDDFLERAEEEFVQIRVGEHRAGAPGSSAASSAIP